MKYLGGPTFGVEPPIGGNIVLRRYYMWIPDKDYDHRCVMIQWIDSRLADGIRNAMSPDDGLVVLKTFELMRAFNPRERSKK